VNKDTRRSVENIQKDIKRFATRSLLVGAIIGVLLGFVLGFVVGHTQGDKTIVIPLGEGIKV
tara:strand:- start:981 stop:1166 length:186 start_codon:yes stop_codon:yes gene_type:complete